jgi:WD40 repeat protein
MTALQFFILVYIQLFLHSMLVIKNLTNISHFGEYLINSYKQFGMFTLFSQDLDPALVRGEGQLCKVPERLLKSVSPPTANCLSASFSVSGRFLAAASDHSIHVFKVKNASVQNIAASDMFLCCVQEAAQWGLQCVLKGHEGLVYSVAWFQDQWLLSASADCLAVVWDVDAETMAWVKN